MKRPFVTLCLGLGVAFAAAGVGAAEQLITEAEAALPTSPDTGIAQRGITRGPSVEQVLPAPQGNTSSPLTLTVKFVARNNVAIDKDSVKVTYLKSPAVDLTSRVKAYVTPDGIDMKRADVPPGTHMIRIDLKDLQGRASTATIKLSVAGK